MLSSRNAMELTAILSLCTLSLVAFLPYENVSDVRWGRRYLQAGEDERPLPPPGDYLDDQSTNLVYPWAKSNLVPHTVLPDPTKETYMFWHIPKSGGSTAKQIYKCMGLTVTVQSTEESIMKAKDLNLVQSGKVDIIFSSRPQIAVQHLYDSSHKGRLFVIMRHPVERLISKFYYLQIATWERTYRAEWRNMDILEWVENHNADNNQMVKQLAGKKQLNTATEEDLAMAMHTIKARFVVGLMNQMEESVARFNLVMGVDFNGVREKSCWDKYFGHGIRKSNSNSHPKIDKEHPAFRLIAERNDLDIRLYFYAVELFGEQKSLISRWQREDIG